MTDEETEAAESAGEAVDGETESADDAGEGETFVCGICGMEFDSRDELERHVHDVGIVD